MPICWIQSCFFTFTRLQNVKKLHYCWPFITLQKNSFLVFKFVYFFCLSKCKKMFNHCCWTKLVLKLVIWATEAWNCHTIFFSASCFFIEAGQKHRREDLTSLFFVASAAVSWCSHISSSHPLPLFPSTSPHIHSVYDHTPPLPIFSAAQSVAFCPRVSSGTEQHHPVISITEDLPLVFLPVCQSAYSAPSLHACLPATALPTAMADSCSIHLALNKGSYLSLLWPLFLYCEAQESKLTLKGVCWWGGLSRNLPLLCFTLKKNIHKRFESADNLCLVRNTSVFVSLLSQ